MRLFLTLKSAKKSKVKVTCQWYASLPASPSLITFNSTHLWLSLSDKVQDTCFHVVHAWHSTLKVLKPHQTSGRKKEIIYH